MNNTNILIVDDNKNLSKTISFILQKKGYSVDTAESGAEAIEKIKEKSYYLILLDIKMQVMNGVEAFKKIKKIDSNIIVIMMTAYALEDLIQEALKEGVYGILYKPLDMDKLISLIEKSKKEQESMLISIIDDSEGIRTTLKNILNKKGYKTFISETGEEAIAFSKKNHCDVFIIDMSLPTINGLETYIALKKICPKAVAILITGYPQEMVDLINSALNKSAYTCLQKPLDLEVLLHIIDKIHSKLKN